MSKWEQEITDYIAPSVEALGLELWGVEWIPQKGQSILRIYVEKLKGASVGDCEKVSRQVGAVLDVEMPDLPRYYLEVSTPGIERRFFSLAQLVRYCGSTVRLKLKEKLNDRKNFQGLLKEVNGNRLILNVDNQDIELDYNDVDKAVLVSSV